MIRSFASGGITPLKMYGLTQANQRVWGAILSKTGIDMPALPEISAMDLGALLCSRVCHDIISPVGAIANGLELLDEDGTDEDTKEIAMGLIRSSAVNASSKLQFARIAFGAAGSAGADIDTGDAQNVAQGYFDTEIAPLINEGVQYGGHLQGADLTEAIARASVLLFTPLWDEPFGLAAIEAMACGLPIAAVENGAIREVAGDVARYAGADAGELAEALREAIGILRRAARERVEGLFTLEGMLAAYEGLYNRAIDSVGHGFELPSFEAFELPSTEYALPREL